MRVCISENKILADYEDEEEEPEEANIERENEESKEEAPIACRKGEIYDST